MAAPAPAAPAPAPDGAPAAKRPRVSTTEVAPRPLPLVTHTWTVEEGPLTLASFTAAAADAKWEGPAFEACGLNWQLSVRPNTPHPTAGSGPAYGVYLHLLDRTTAPVELAEATLRVRGVDDHKVTKRFFRGTPPPADQGPACSQNWGFAMLHSRLAAREAAILEGGTMVIAVSLRSRSFAEVSVPVAPPASMLAQLAAALPASPQADGVDVVYKAADGERIGAHSFVLALRSSTLRASLWGPLAPAEAPSASKPRELDIPEGVDADAFRRVLAFLYSDAAPQFDAPELSLGAVHALLHAADYLDVPRLRQMCAAELHARLAPDNAVATLKLAHALSCTELAAVALRYIAANARAVMRAPGWAELAQEEGLKDAVLSTLATGEPPAVVAARKAKRRAPPPSAQQVTVVE